MVCTQNQVLNVLLKSLLDKEKKKKKTYEGATNIINSTLDFPEFFWYPVCCQEEEENNGCS